MKFNKNVHRKFTIKAMLLLVLLCAVGFAVVIVPRVQRNRLAQHLESQSNIVVWVQYSDETLLDSMLGTVRRVESIAFVGTDERSLLSKELFEVLSELPPLIQLELENVEVESGCKFPSVLKRISIRGGVGKECSHWLEGLLASQELVQETEVVDTPAFSDEHVEQLCRIRPLTSITLDRVDVVGTGFRSLSNGTQNLDVSIVNCPVSDDGLEMAVKKGATVAAENGARWWDRG